jgi:hypothetical protein
VRLSPPADQRLEQARLLVGVGGSELNVGCLARLGRRRRGCHGCRKDRSAASSTGSAAARVDTRWVRWMADARLGLMFYERTRTAHEPGHL